MDKKYYTAILDILADAKQKGITAVFAAKPEYSADDTPNTSWPDMIAANTEDPKVITAMLGRNGKEEDE